MTEQERKDAAEHYSEYGYKLAVLIGQLEDLQESCEALSESCHDEGLPADMLTEALTKLGSALATMRIYEHEYATGEDVK